MNKATNAYKIFIEKQNSYLELFKQGDLMRLVKSDILKSKELRLKLLDALQPFSNYFQKSVMLRYLFTEQEPFLHSAQEHLAEEFRHNVTLETDRANRSIAFNPAIESAASWFSWKMFSLDHLQKTVLIHWVLEASANIFFKDIHEKNYYHETNYFKTHADLDEAHQTLPETFFDNLRLEEITNLLMVIDQGWQVLLLATNAIAAATHSK